MYNQLERPTENKSRAITNAIAQKKSNAKQSAGFADDRLEAVTQRTLQGIIDNDSVPKPAPLQAHVHAQGINSLIQRKLNHVANQILLYGTDREKQKLIAITKNSPVFQLNKLCASFLNESNHLSLQTIDKPIQLLRDHYNFGQGRFVRDLSNEHRGVYLVSADTENIVVKFDPNVNEVSLMKLARQIGMDVPQSRVLSPQEVTDVKNMDRKIKGNGAAIVMEFARGDALEYFCGNHEADQMGVIFNQQLLVDIGKSYGFQLLTGSADHWSMPVNVGADTHTSGNSGNILVDTQSNRIHDIDFTDGSPSDDYAESLREYFREMLESADGGSLVRNVTNFIAREYHAHYVVPDQAKPQIVQGIKNAMDDIVAIDIGSTGVSQSIQNRIAAVRQVYIQEAQRLNRQNRCCYITTACTEAYGISDNCLELETLRAFRDGYIAKKDKGNELIQLYYNYSPLIVSAIKSKHNFGEIYSSLYNVIHSCVRRIWEEEYEKAFQIYINMVLKLCSKYTPEFVIPENIKHYIETVMHGSPCEK